MCQRVQSRFQIHINFVSGTSNLKLFSTCSITSFSFNLLHIRLNFETNLKSFTILKLNIINSYTKFKEKLIDNTILQKTISTISIDFQYKLNLITSLKSNIII